MPSAKAEGARAARNAIKLALSLTATWTVALVVKFQLPRHLGPLSFGNFNFSEAFAAAFIAFLGLGIEVHIQKEVAVRPDTASSFFGGVVLLRLMLSIPLFAAMLLTLYLTGRGERLPLLVISFGCAQFVAGLNGTLAAMLQATARINVLAAVNVAAKLVWGVGVAVGVMLDWPIFVLTLPSLASELLRWAVLYRAARREIGLRFKVDAAATKAVLLASLPFYVNTISIGLMNRTDVSVLEFMSPGDEVGWYGAANNFASLSMLLSPLFTWVLLPLFSRAKERSPEEFFSMVQRSIEGLVGASIPITLLIALGAELWIRVAFNASFAPAAISLRFLAPTFVGTYLAMLLSSALVITGQSWRLTSISFAGMLVQPVLMVIGIFLFRGVGPGYAGAGTALGVSGAELMISLLLLRSIGTRLLDRRNIRVILTSLAVAAIVIVIHLALKGLGYWRLIVDGVAYVALALALRAVDIKDLRAAVDLVRSSRKKS